MALDIFSFAVFLSLLLIYISFWANFSKNLKIEKKFFKKDTKFNEFDIIFIFCVLGTFLIPESSLDDYGLLE